MSRRPDLLQLLPADHLPEVRFGIKLRGSGVGEQHDVNWQKSLHQRNQNEEGIGQELQQVHFDPLVFNVLPYRKSIHPSPGGPQPEHKQGVRPNLFQTLSHMLQSLHQLLPNWNFDCHFLIIGQVILRVLLFFNSGQLFQSILWFHFFHLITLFFLYFISQVPNCFKIYLLLFFLIPFPSIYYRWLHLTIHF